MKLEAAPLSLGYNIHENTLMVATALDITEYQIAKSQPLNKYSTDPDDSHIDSIQFTEDLLAFRTSNNYLHLYDRSQHKINELRRRI